MVRNSRTGSEMSDLTGDSAEDEAHLFQEIAQKHRPYPAGIQRIDFRFGEDSAGAPAVWIVLITPDDLKPSQERISAIRSLAEDIQYEIHRTGSDRWPYVTIEAE